MEAPTPQDLSVFTIFSQAIRSGDRVKSKSNVLLCLWFRFKVKNVEFGQHLETNCWAVYLSSPPSCYLPSCISLEYGLSRLHPWVDGNLDCPIVCYFRVCNQFLINIYYVKFFKLLSSLPFQLFPYFDSTIA